MRRGASPCERPVAAYLRPDPCFSLIREPPFDDQTIPGSRKQRDMEGHPEAARPPLHCDRIDPEELETAWLLLRSVTPRLDWIAKHHGWPTPFGPARYLVLVALERASSFGLTPRRISRAVALSPSTVAHHLDVMERAGLVRRAPRGIYDKRKISVLLTPAGRYALLRFTGP